MFWGAHRPSAGLSPTHAFSVLALLAARISFCLSGPSSEGHSPGNKSTAKACSAREEQTEDSSNQML